MENRNEWSYIWKSAVSITTTGTLKPSVDHWDKDALGVGYAYLRNYGISEEKPFRNTKCIYIAKNSIAAPTSLFL